MLTVARSGHTLLERLTQVVGRGEPQLAADVGSLGVDIALGLAEETADVAQLFAAQDELADGFLGGGKLGEDFVDTRLLGIAYAHELSHVGKEVLLRSLAQDVEQIAGMLGAIAV